MILMIAALTGAKEQGMNLLTRLCGLMILAVSLTLGGCGGGGSEVIGDVPLPQDSTALTLSGLVTDDPVVNAAIMFKVGNREFNGPVPTDSQGQFSLQIEAESPDDLVVGNAHDVANGVFLTAVLDTYEGCLNLATDNVVNNVKVTNITTAQQVLAERLALDGSIDDFDEFVALLPQIDAMEMLELASSIKAVVENINGTVLPSGYAHTLELARSIADGSSTFNADVETVSPGTLAAAQNKLLSDGNATVPIAAAEAPGVYSAVGNDFIYAVFADGSAMVENFDDDAVPGTPSWNITSSGRLQVNYFGYIRNSDSFTSMGGNNGIMHLVADYTDSDDAPAGRAAATVNKYNFGAAFDASAVSGTVADPQFDGDDLVFAADGSGVARDRNNPGDQLTFDWSITAEGYLRLDFVETPRSTEFINLATGDTAMVLSVTRYNEQWPTLAVSTWEPN